MEQHHYDAGASGMGPCNALVERDGAGDTCGQPADDPAHHPDGGPALPVVGDRPELELIQRVMAELGVEHPGDVLEALEKRFNALILARQSRDENRRERLRAEDEVRRLTAQLDAMPRPTTLRLPQIPDGTIALRGNRTGRRYRPSRRHEDRWVVEDHAVQVLHSLASVLIFEDPDGVEPEFAGPREPLIWPQLRTSPDTVTAVQVNGERWDFAYVTTRGVRMFRRESERGSRSYSDSKSLGHLRELGEVHEIVE